MHILRAAGRCALQRLQEPGQGYWLLKPQLSLHPSKRSTFYAADTGAKANASLGLDSELIIENCRLADNVNGVESSGAVVGEHGTVWISSSTITASSSQGLGQSFTGVVYSRGNNTVEANASNTFGTITLFSGR